MEDEALAQTMAGVVIAAGTRFGRYRIVRLLGVGGMGAVYRALDTELDEEVALKVLRAQLAGHADALLRFRREVKLARRVTHPNVARTYDLGMHEGHHFLTMELIDGEPLARRVGEGKTLSLPEVLRVGAEVARGLAAAHAVNVVHRDLKPENVMTSGDRIVITDFGIARLSEPFSMGDMKQSGSIVGTPAYMAPEQVEGRELDGRTDVYALGMLLFEALTGRLAFDAPTPLGTLAMRLTEDPPDPRAHDRRIPEPVASLVLEMIGRRREKRPPAQSVLERLDVLRGNASPLGPRELPIAVESSRRRLALLALRAENEDAAALARSLDEALAECAHRTEHLDARVGEGAVTSVDLVLSGSVRVSQNRIRVRIRLSDVAQGKDRFVGRIDGTVGAELDLEDRVMEATLHAMNELGSPRPLTVSPNVRELYEQGRASLASLEPERYTEGVAMLERALGLAPDDARVQSALAMALVKRVVAADMGGPPTDMGRAEELCLRAFAADPTGPEALSALGMLRYVTGDMRGAARAFREALLRGPTEADANVYLGRLLEESGYASAALQRMAIVEHHHPDRPEPYWVYARAAMFDHDFEQMDRMLDSAARVSGSPRYSVLTSARAACWWRDRALAERCLAAFSSVNSTVAKSSLVPLLSIVTGDKTALDSSLIEYWFSSYDPPSLRMRTFRHQIATEAYLLCGDIELALGQLEAGAAHALIDLAWMDRCPLLSELRDSPRFAAARAIVAARVADMWS